jgi:hypothetical protein
MSSIDVEEILDSQPLGPIKEFLNVALNALWNHRTFRGMGTGSNDIPVAGLIPQAAKLGNVICVLYGCSVPVVLRKQPREFNRPFWELIGEAYVHGFMDGEGLRYLSPTALKSAEIRFEIR